MVDDNIIAQLRDLHPPASGPIPVLPNDAPLIQQVDLVVLSRLVRSLANGAAPGPSGWTGDLLLALIDDHDCLAALGHLVKDIVNGALTGRARELLVSSTLVATKKPSGGCRPIAMGEVFYRVACLYALDLVRDPIRTVLGPIQFGLSPGGAASALHVLQSALDLHPDWIIISTDIANAFNSRSRPDILSSLFNSPDLAPLFRLANWSYGSDSALLLMNHGRVAAELSSCEGVRQGDVLGSLLFCLSMRHCYSNCIVGVDCHAVADIDDFYLLGPPDDVFTAFDRFSGALPHLLLHLNLPKSIALLPDDPSANLIAQCTSRGLPYSVDFIPALGSILSRNPDTISTWLEDQVSSLHEPFFKTLLDSRLPSQYAFSLLRICLVPRMNYLSRVIAPSIFASAARNFDALVVDTFCQRLKLPVFTDVARSQLWSCSSF